jgi:hypothetical protein
VLLIREDKKGNLVEAETLRSKLRTRSRKRIDIWNKTLSRERM